MDENCSLQAKENVWYGDEIDIGKICTCIEVMMEGKRKVRRGRRMDVTAVKIIIEKGGKSMIY